MILDHDTRWPEGAWRMAEDVHMRDASQIGVADRSLLVHGRSYSLIPFEGIGKLESAHLEVEFVDRVEDPKSFFADLAVDFRERRPHEAIDGTEVVNGRHRSRLEDLTRPFVVP